MKGVRRDWGNCICVSQTKDCKELFIKINGYIEDHSINLQAWHCFELPKLSAALYDLYTAHCCMLILVLFPHLIFLGLYF